MQEIHAPLQEALRARFAHMTREEIVELNRLLQKLREPGCEIAKGAFLGECAAVEATESE